MTEQGQRGHGLVPVEVAALRDQYRERREQSLLDAAATAISMNAIIYADTIDYSAFTPQMMEAFSLSNPNSEITDRLASLDFDNSDEVAGFLSNWRGKYFEVLVRDELNSGGQVGDLVLAEGQTAVLAENLSQPGWDLQIVSGTGLPVNELQLKATDSISYVKGAIERYPGIDVLTTDEVAASVIDEAVISSGVSNAELSEDLSEPLDGVLDSPLQDAIETFGMGLPVLLIAGTEGTMWLVGRQTFDSALTKSVDRAVKSGVAMAVGGLVALTGVSVLALPATVVTRLAITRYSVFDELGDRMDADTAKVLMLSEKNPHTGS